MVGVFEPFWRNIFRVGDVLTANIPHQYFLRYFNGSKTDGNFVYVNEGSAPWPPSFAVVMRPLFLAVHFLYRNVDASKSLVAQSESDAVSFRVQRNAVEFCLQLDRVFHLGLGHVSVA